MHFRARKALVVLAVGLTIGAPSASGETIWQWTHQAEGEGWAHVFDGGPVEFDSGSTTGPGDTGMGFLAVDLTRPGVLGATYWTGGESNAGANEERFGTTLRLFTHYSATSRVGSDRPGGEGNGRISSVVEFVVPADEVEWLVRLDVDQTTGFTGSTHLLLQNVTDGETLFESYQDLDESFILQGLLGDTMSLTIDSQGQGSVPAGIPAIGFYEVDVSTLFIIPEPATMAMGALGILAMLRRRP